MPRTLPQLDASDPLRKPVLQSVVLHGGLLAAMLGYTLFAHLHGAKWGNNSLTAGAIQATMVASAPTIPLPKDEQKPTESVLATPTPSPAPAPPAPKAPPQEEEKTIPVPVKQKVKPKLTPKKTAPQPVKQPAAKPTPQPAAKHVEPVKPTNRANYGEAAPNTPRAMPQATPAAQVNVQGR